MSDRTTWMSVSHKASQQRLWPLDRRASYKQQWWGARRLYLKRGLSPWPPARRCR